MFNSQILRLVISLAAFVLSAQAQTSDSTKIYLWTEGAPLAKGTEEIDKPSITVYFPAKEKATGAAVLICPGGGYVALALNHEGWQVAKWYNDLGITAIILRYRVNSWDHQKYQYPAQWMDVSKAMRMVRTKAQDWKLNPQKIGVMGFSAGGHLASCLGTMYDEGNPKAKDPIEKFSNKPDFMVLVYPVISFNTKHASVFSRGNFAGENASQSFVDSMSTYSRVTSKTPPTFIMFTDEDKVNAMNGILFYTALKENKVSAELHIYERGPHGYGIYPKEERIADWTERLKNWLRNREWIIK
jgi:acetyl esterase/lipase